MNKVQIEDCENIGKLDFIDWKQFQNTSILITGSTGLIGSNLVNSIAYNNQKKGLNIKLILLVRDTDAAMELFSWTDAIIVSYDLETEPKVAVPIDYIVHLASPTGSRYFIEKPVETMQANINGAETLLNWAKEHPVKKFIGLSTMEVYGFPRKGHKVKENEIGAFETMNTRNSYPIAKIACEALYHSYYIQYGVPAVVLRATQTFGPGIKYDDERVFAQFMRCAIEKKDIILKSTGMTERSYLYTGDCVSAILVSLLRATPGESYTIANPETYCSIKEMAKMVVDRISGGEIKVVFDIVKDIARLGYIETVYMDLDIEKMRNLGWMPKTKLEDMFMRMIRYAEDKTINGPRV